jgi:hypothetical protein
MVKAILCVTVKEISIGEGGGGTGDGIEISSYRDDYAGSALINTKISPEGPTGDSIPMQVVSEITFSGGI